MLHTSTIDAETLSLLRELLALPVLASHSLVGGTALALQYGHRISVDLDLFSNEQPLVFDEIVEALQLHFDGRFAYEGNFSRAGIFCYIDDIKVDIVHYPHQRIAPLVNINGIRMHSPIDICAMKIQAILGRGRKKDFWDMAELLQHFTVQEIIENHRKKYPNQMLLISIPQALTYFTDAEESEDPISLKGQTWESIKKTIQQKVSEYLM